MGQIVSYPNPTFELKDAFAFLAGTISPGYVWTFRNMSSHFGPTATRFSGWRQLEFDFRTSQERIDSLIYGISSSTDPKMSDEFQLKISLRLGS